MRPCHIPAQASPLPIQAAQGPRVDALTCCAVDPVYLTFLLDARICRESPPASGEHRSRQLGICRLLRLRVEQIAWLRQVLGSLVLGELALRTARRRRVSLTAAGQEPPLVPDDDAASWGRGRWGGQGSVGHLTPVLMRSCRSCSLSHCGRSGPCRAMCALKTRLSNLTVS